MKTPSLVLALSALVCAVAVAADDPPAPPPGQAILYTPEPIPPTVVNRMLRARPTADVRPPGAPADELDGLRAVSLREGAADVTLDGVARKLTPGDAVGSATVRAIGTNRIVLERPFAVPGGTPSRATVVVTFGQGGRPRVRAIVDVGAMPPPIPFGEAH